MATRLVVEPGMRFGDDSRLEVVREVAPIESGGQKQRAVECRCDCGDVRVYRLYSLRNGNTRSCGCLAEESGNPGRQTHGCSELPEYAIWCGIRRRCSNPTDSAWKNYGGRGIRVCSRWNESFEAFFADMGPRPSDNHSIDRFPDNNGDYEPGNCRWATAKEQARNTRRNYLVFHNGETKCVAEWAEQYRVKSCILYSRLIAGWPFEEAVGLRVRPVPSKDPFYLTPMKERGPDWQREHQRREVRRIELDRRELPQWGVRLAKTHRVDPAEFIAKVDSALVDGWTRKGSIWRALHEMGAVP